MTCLLNPVAWLNANGGNIIFYESRTKVDFSKQDDYIHRQMEFISEDLFKKNVLRTTVLRKHDLEL